jgi:hypothetical protein
MCAQLQSALLLNTASAASLSGDSAFTSAVLVDGVFPNSSTCMWSGPSLAKLYQTRPDAFGITTTSGGYTETADASLKTQQLGKQRIGYYSKKKPKLLRAHVQINLQDTSSMHRNLVGRAHSNTEEFPSHTNQPRTHSYHSFHVHQLQLYQQNQHQMQQEFQQVNRMHEDMRLQSQFGVHDDTQIRSQSQRRGLPIS